MWYDHYEADDYLNKDEAETFLTELASEFLKRRDSDLALKVRIVREAESEIYMYNYCD